MAIGLTAAFAAALLISGGLVLQAVDARQVSERHGLRLSLLTRLLQRPWWLAGTAIGYLAFPFQLLALSHAPLIVVQPVHAFGLLLVLAAGVRFLRERVGPAEMIGVAAIVAGLGLVAWGAPSGRDPAISNAALFGATGSMVLLAFLPYLLGSRCGRLTLIFTAGIGFAGANMAVKGFSDQLGAHHYLVAATYLAAAAVGSIVSVLSQMTAFQRHRAVEVVPVTFAVPIFLPVLLGIVVLHERWATAALSGAPFAIGATLLLIGTAAVTRTAAVIGVARPEAAA
jgi:drug/metabolite transporter (DMT)-like permease